MEDKVQALSSGVEGDIEEALLGTGVVKKIKIKRFTGYRVEVTMKDNSRINREKVYDKEIELTQFYKGERMEFQVMNKEME